MDETERDAQRNILLNWNKLTLGDISVIQAALSKPDFQIVTMPETAHSYFWTQLVRLGWAVECDVPQTMAIFPTPPVIFKLTNLGLVIVPKFMAGRDLFNLTIRNNTVRDRRSPEPPGEFNRDTRSP